MGRARLSELPAEATDVDAGADASGCVDAGGGAAPGGGTAAALQACCCPVASIAKWAVHSTTPPLKSAPRNSSLAEEFPEEATVPVAHLGHSGPKIYCRAPDVINLFDPLE